MISKVNPKAIGAQPAEPGRSRLMRGNPNGCRPAWKRRSCDYARPPAASPLPRGWGRPRGRSRRGGDTRPPGPPPLGRPRYRGAAGHAPAVRAPQRRRQQLTSDDSALPRRSAALRLDYIKLASLCGQVNLPDGGGAGRQRDLLRRAVPRRRGVGQPYSAGGLPSPKNQATQSRPPGAAVRVDSASCSPACLKVTTTNGVREPSRLNVKPAGDRVPVLVHRVDTAGSGSPTGWCRHAAGARGRCLQPRGRAAVARRPGARAPAAGARTCPRGRLSASHTLLRWSGRFTRRGPRPEGGRAPGVRAGSPAAVTGGSAGRGPARRARPRSRTRPRPRGRPAGWSGR